MKKNILTLAGTLSLLFVGYSFSSPGTITNTTPFPVMASINYPKGGCSAGKWRMIIEAGDAQVFPHFCHYESVTAKVDVTLDGQWLVDAVPYKTKEVASPNWGDEFHIVQGFAYMAGGGFGVEKVR